MALGNLNIVITADTSSFISSMNASSAAAREHMTRSSDAVNAFASGMNARSIDFQTASRNMGKSMQDAAAIILQAANDNQQAIQSMSKAANDVKFDGVGEKLAAAMGAGAGAAYAVTETFLQKTEDLVKAKLIITGVAIATGVAAAALSAGYAVYKAGDFIVGLFTGDSYKSRAIDALIAQEKKVAELQDRLQMTAVQANALADALGRIGVSKEDYVGTYEKTRDAMRGNTEELDRLGVKYKDHNGKLLESREFLTNVKNKLDEYTVGWDRNSAAAAMGVGSYAAVNAALKVTPEEIAKSKARLDDYNLGLGPESQAAVEAYKKSMLEFNNEVKLTGDGFSRAWADQIMPALTDMAAFFKEGFPFAVNAFRYSMATLTSLFYGLKTVVYMVSESIIGSLSAIGSMFAGVGSAAAAVMSGDFSGAKDALLSGWEDAKTRLGQIGDGIVIQAKHNADAMKLAWAFDNRTDPLAKSKTEQADIGTGKWVPPPKKETAQTAVASAFDKYMADIERMTTKVDNGAIAEMRQKAAELAKAEKRPDTSAAQIGEYQKAQENMLMKDYDKSLELQSKQYDYQVTLIGKTAQQQEILNLKHQDALALQAKIEAHEKTIGPLTAESRAAMIAAETNATASVVGKIEERQAKEREWASGVKTATTGYMDTISNAAAQSNTLFTNAFKGSEDALTKFYQTGKFGAADFLNVISSALARLAAQKTMLGLSNMASGSGVGSWLGSLFANGGSFDGGGVQAFANGGTFTNSIVDSPTMFKFANGGGFSSGVMGEAGPEAVMPLTRGADGKLGVVAQGAGAQSGAGAVTVQVVVNTQTGTSQTTGNGTPALASLGTQIGNMVRDILVQEKRPGGVLA